MYSRLIDLETLGKVVAASPVIFERTERLARLIVEVLNKYALQNDPKVGLNGEKYWEMDLRDLTFALPGNETPKRIGGICRELGLSSRRFNHGFRIYWSKEQLKLLSQALQ